MRYIVLFFLTAFSLFRVANIAFAQEASLNGDIVYVVGEANCTKSVAQGGWGGTCKEPGLGIPGVYNATGCDDFLSSKEKFVGVCNPPGLLSDRSDCCVPTGTAAPSKPAYESIYYTESFCNAAYGTDSKGNLKGVGGTCTDVLTSVLSSSCGDGKIAAGYCGTFGGTNVCCAPRDGDYVKALCKQDPTNSNCNAVSGDASTSASPTLSYGEYTLLEPLPGADNTSGNLQTYLETLYKVALVLVALSAIFMLTWGGFVYMTAAANTALLNKAKSIIRDAIVGLLIALGAWLILYIINPNLVNLTLNGLAPVSVSNGGASVLPSGVTSNLPAQEAAKTLLASSNVTPYNVNSCTGSTTAGSKDNLEQAAAGKGMNRCSCGGGGSVAADPTLLNSLVDIANAGAKFQINVIAGGCHEGGSNDSHYLGKAADIQRSSTLDAFFAKYPKTTCQGSKVGYKVSGEVVCLEDSRHYHVSPTGG